MFLIFLWIYQVLTPEYSLEYLYYHVYVDQVFLSILQLVQDLI